MKESAPIRIAADISFFFLLCSQYYTLGVKLWLFAAFVGACLVFGFLASRPSNPFFRILLTLPPLALLLFADGLISILLLAVAWLYFALMHIFGKTAMEYYIYRKAYIAMALIGVVGFFVARVIPLFPEVNLISEITFFLLFGLLGVMALRELRMGIRTNLRWMSYSALSLIVPIVGAVAATFLLALFLKTFGKYLQYIFAPLVLFLWAIEKIFGNLFEHAVPAYNSERETFEPVEIETGEGVPWQPKEEQATPTGPLEVDWMLILVIAMVVVVLTVAIILLVRYLRKNQRPVEEEQLGAQDETEFRMRRQKRKKVVAIPESQKIREIYRMYLRDLRIKGQTIRQENTSLDILREAEKKTDEAPNETLRAIYLIARYGDASRITTEQTELAKTCLNQIHEALGEEEATFIVEKNRREVRMPASMRLQLEGQKKLREQHHGAIQKGNIWRRD